MMNGRIIHPEQELFHYYSGLLVSRGRTMLERTFTHRYFLIERALESVERAVVFGGEAYHASR